MIRIRSFPSRESERSRHLREGRSLLRRGRDGPTQLSFLSYAASSVATAATCPHRSRSHYSRLSVLSMKISEHARAGRIPLFRIGTCVWFAPHRFTHWLRRNNNWAVGRNPIERYFHRMLEKLPGISAVHSHNDWPFWISTPALEMGGFLMGAVPACKRRPVVPC